jgi:ATP-binding cassette subfamily B protein
MIAEKPEISSAPDAPEFVPREGRVEFKDVTFSYAPDVPLYRGLSLSVEPGMTVALVGQTGCGKTTFTSLLMRYWDIQDGAILIDGQNIKEVQLESLRRQFGVVLQAPVIFDGTVRENIAYGLPSSTSDDRIIEAAKAAEIYSSIMRLPEGLDTMVGTEGVKLSVGEKQRLSIARAIIKDPLILIMDEATSSLDSESEALIQKALDTVLKGRTSFVVAHRLSTITNADMIVVMDKGAIIEKGRHDELMEIDGGHYRKLYEELRGTRGAEVE